ncbi:Ribosomal RNA small subunit methyltransferase J [compost metagenome]
MFVTTSYHPTPAELEQARSLAARLGCLYVQRRQSSLPRLQREHGTQDIVVATTLGLRYFPEGSKEPFFFHPSSAQVRIKRMLHGMADGLLEAAGVQEGDAILDCTAGLCSESILFAYAAGPGGEVTALESEPLIALLVEEGLKTYESGLEVLDQAMRRVKVIQTGHLSELKRRPDKSADVVYFDPMFRQTIEDTSALAPLKAIANGSELQAEAVLEARRVARRRVVLKEHRESGEFERLGFRMLLRPNTKIAYGVMDV